jgi:hypothetical protein
MVAQESPPIDEVGVWLTLVIVGVFVLPHYMISGHHGRFWFLP